MGVAEEMLTGQGILEQIGVTHGAPSDVLTAALLVLMCTPTAVLSAKTLVDAQTGQMTVRQFKRWANLLGLRNDEDAEVVAYMKKADGLAAALRLRSVADLLRRKAAAEARAAVSAGGPVAARGTAAAPSGGTSASSLRLVEQLLELVALP